jgi:uncharacterized membrane protein
MEDKTTNQATENAKYIRDVLAKEITYKRERREQIFSWASSLLVAIIGGTIALTYTKHQRLPGFQQVILTGAALVLGIKACVWMYYHRRDEIRARNNIERYDELLGIPEEKHRSPVDLGHTLAIILLTLAAICAVLVTP